MEKQIDIIKENIELVLNKLCIDFDEIQFVEKNDFNKGFKFIIKTNDSGILIGNEGANIYAFNHVVKKIIWKKTSEFNEKINFFIDVNDYQSNNIDKIKKEALNVATKTDLFKRDIEMPAANSYERMIIHATLVDNDKVYTESIGEGEFRRVVVKPR
ncbi:MAG: hypothetical protein KAJ58_00355 [Candidatus Pacebacteria bacterium]|nr:hypothetical protein [Candidatus Paceibacterota bacterium]